MSTADLGYAPEVEALIAIRELSEESADLNRRLAIVVGDFIVNNLAHDPLVLAMFDANDKQHFAEGMQSQRAYFESRWVEYLATDWCHAVTNGSHCHAPIINGVPLCSHEN